MLADESTAPEAVSIESSMDDDDCGKEPLLLNQSSNTEPADSQGIFSNENLTIYSHIFASFVFLLAGHAIVPLFAVAAGESLRTDNIPFQKTAAGDVILDLDLNFPVKDPATVPSKYYAM